MKKFLIASVLSLGVAFSAQAKDIVDTAVGAGSFKTLAAALGAAGLVDTLKGKGPFTVFAPTDEAFAKIPKADLDVLLKDKAKLTAILTYHVVPGKVMAADVRAGKVKTVQGSELTISTTGGVMVDNAKVVKTDIVADNGVIHVIDSVRDPQVSAEGFRSLPRTALHSWAFWFLNRAQPTPSMNPLHLSPTRLLLPWFAALALLTAQPSRAQSTAPAAAPATCHCGGSCRAGALRPQLGRPKVAAHCDSLASRPTTPRCGCPAQMPRSALHARLRWTFATPLPSRGGILPTPR